MLLEIRSGCAINFDLFASTQVALVQKQSLLMYLTDYLFPLLIEQWLDMEEA